MARGCPLCGAEDHSLPSCGLRARSAVVRCDAFQSNREEGEAEVAKTVQAVCDVAPERTRWHDNVLYITLASEEDAVKLVEVAAGEGLEVGGELVSVERAQEAAAKGSGPRERGDQRAAGLRPKARRRVPTPQSAP
uniref:Uncharacterized protein n=1 Tax=Alexandrium monilatum TaxID=311494 RepID=A0A7S4QRH8_9DINO